ncbi:MAG: right-handed parallel beta-helix repeat-containing protein [Bacteroidales bacterium]|nr:right-handed parallel beta-helix repeat-containing protein [Bacteroidales bacterium]MCF8392048.1 right-handed parallel beta-helix repeat-containing protein [Bacteroidales bacterium]
MKYLKFNTILVILVSVFLCSSKKQDDSKIVFINNQADFDQYKNSSFQAGTQILFAAGKAFNGQFAPTGSGTKENPIRLTAYNPKSKKAYWEDIDNKPIINGHGKVNSPFYLYNGAFWEINNLELTNTNGTDEDQGNLRGIYILAEDAGIVENVSVRNCYIHDVNGKVEGKQRGGIHVHIKGKEIRTKFHNLLIENNYIKNVGGVGIGNTSTWGDIHSNDYFPWTDFVIRGNRVEHTGRNGIIARMGINQIVEYNVLAHNSRYSSGHSVFNFASIGCIMQYNEAYGNVGEADEIDHGGFDADYNARGTIIQYNYSHDNNWFCGIMRRYNRDITIRYNITVNERLGAYEYGFPAEDDARGIWIYNNTHYFRAGLNASIFASPGKVRTPSYTYFYNNIFYFEDKGTWGVEPDETCEFKNNLFFNVEPKGRGAIVADPLFVNPGAVDYDVNMRDPERLSGYKLKDNSPAINAGIVINDMGGKDFWGNPVGTESIDIGAYEKQ